MERIEKNHVKNVADALDDYFNGNENVNWPVVPEHLQKRSKAYVSDAEKEIDDYLESMKE